METLSMDWLSTENSFTSTSNSTVINDEEEEGLFPHTLTWLIAVGIVYWLIIVVTLIGNAFVMAAYKVDDRIRARPSSLLILNLSISDFLVGITFIFNYIFLLYDIWPLGEIPCKLWIVLDYTCSFMSVITITLISLDRYWMVKKKLGYRKYQTKKRILITLAICWSVVISFYTITAFGYGAMTGTNHVDFSEDCEMEYLYSLPFSAVMIVVEFVIPFFIIVYLNIVVYMNIQMRTGELVRSKPDKGPNTTSKTSTDADKSIGTDSTNALAFFSNHLYSKPPVPIVTISYTTKDDAPQNGTTESTDVKHANAYEVDDAFEESKASDDGIVTGGTNIAPNGFSNPIVDLHDVNVKTESQAHVLEPQSENTNNNANHNINGSNDGKLKVQNKTRPVSDVSLNSVASVASDGHTTLARATKEQNRKKAREFRRQRRAAIVLFTLVIAFAICWLPYQITTILVTIMGDGSVNFIAEEVMTNLLWCNSTINPFLYALVTVSFRRNFLRFLGLHRVTCCQKQPSSDEMQDRTNNINTSDPTQDS